MGRTRNGSSGMPPLDKSTRGKVETGGASNLTAGALAASTWLRNLATAPAQPQWHVEVSLDVLDVIAPLEFDETTASRFHIDIYSSEWGLYVCHGGQSSWIRITDVAFMHGRDD